MEIAKLFYDFMKQTHVLIAGATGAGKSTVLNGFIYSVTQARPDAVKLVLIDPKRVELAAWKDAPHVLAYASEHNAICGVLRSCVDLMERRYTELQDKGLKVYPGSDVYIIIDELADVVLVSKNRALTYLQRLAMLGRAAKVHIIAGTQRPTKNLLSGLLCVNLDARLALRCATAQDSRNIVGVKGAELLPRVGFGLYLSPETMKPAFIETPFIPERVIQEHAAALSGVKKTA